MTNERRQILRGLSESLHRGKVGTIVKPHKDILLLALFKQYERNPQHGNHFAFTTELEEDFKKLWRSEVPYLEYSPAILELPYYYLQGDGIWLLTVKPEMQELFNSYQRITKRRILDCCADGAFSDAFYSIVENQEEREYFEEITYARLRTLAKTSHSIITQPQVPLNGFQPGIGVVNMNRFVAYLNTLHSVDASNKGALAEAQAKEPMFSELQVSHPWASDIFNTLTKENGSSVILSGHAGDGKTTIAIEVLRKLLGLARDELLPDGLKKIEEVEYLGRKVSIVKDLSECSASERDEIFHDITSGARYLLISNTGTLLDFFKKYGTAIGRKAIEIEDVVSTSLYSSVEAYLDLGTTFVVYNLARCDNATIGMELLHKMVTSSLWEQCESCTCKGGCPIFANREILRKYAHRIFERIALLYFRAYSYGERMTMRQISAHFAYMLTSGLDCNDVVRLGTNGQLRHDGRYCFINRFWGDDGEEEDPMSLQLKAVRVFRDQPFNANFSPALERRFWADVDECFDLGVPELAVESKRMWRLARRSGSKELLKHAANARRTWRRYVYFLFDPTIADGKLRADYNSFVTSFLDSPMSLKYWAWLNKGEPFLPKVILGPIFSVLQEEFCGYLPFAGSASGGDLYITMRQRNSDITQSAQLILKKIVFSDCFKICMSGDSVKLPTLCGEDELEGIALTLDLPFLDYVVE